MKAIKKTTTTRYDVAEHLRSPEEKAAYLEACLAEASDDPAFIAKALSDVAQAKTATRQMKRIQCTRVDQPDDHHDH